MLTPFIAVDYPKSDFIQQLHQSSLLDFPWLRLTEIRFDLQQYDSSLFAAYGLSLPSHLDRAVNKRRAEYLASRYAARIALQAYGVAGFVLQNDVDRSPIWPDSIVGALTHTSGRAVIITAPFESRHHVGVDVEKLIAESTARELSRMIASESEMLYLHQCDVPFATALTLAFSLKESLYKALYPRLKQFIDFHAAEVVHVDFKTGQAVLQLTECLSDELTAGRQFTGYFQQQQDEVLTIVLYKSRP